MRIDVGDTDVTMYGTGGDAMTAIAAYGMERWRSIPGRYRRAICVVFLLAYIAAGIYTELHLIHRMPLPSFLMADMSIYTHSFTAAIHHHDPYADRFVGTGFVYPPPSLFVIGLFAKLPSTYILPVAYITANLFLLAAMLWLIATYNGYRLEHIWWWYPLAFGFAPFLELLHIGQINLIVDGCVLLLFVFEDEHEIVAGAGLGLAVALKVTPIAFVVYLLAKRRWRVLGWTALSLAILVVAAGAVFGWQTLPTYITVLHNLSSSFNPGGGDAISIVSALNAHGWASLAVMPRLQTGIYVYAIAMALVSAWAAWTDHHWVALFVVIGLIRADIPNVFWYHHYVFMLLPLFVLMGASRLHPVVVGWCSLGLLLIQGDRKHALSGLGGHLFVELTVLAIVVWQIYPWLVRHPLRQRVPASGTLAD